MKHIQITFSLFPHNYSFMSVSLLFSSYANTKLWLIFWFISALSIIPHMKPVTESNRLYFWKYFLHLLWPQIAFPVQALTTSCLISLFSVSHTFHFASCCWTHHLRYCAYSAAWVIENWIDCCLLPYGVKFLVSFSRPSLSPPLKLSDLSQHIPSATAGRPLVAVKCTCSYLSVYFPWVSGLPSSPLGHVLHCSVLTSYPLLPWTFFGHSASFPHLCAQLVWPYHTAWILQCHDHTWLYLITC